MNMTESKRQNPATVCRVIASLLLQLNNLYENRVLESKDRTLLIDGVNERIEQVVKDFMPSGLGIDSGTKLSNSSTSEKLEFVAPFHHMDSHGWYDGWTDHKIIVKPSLLFGTSMRVTGRDRNQIKEYLAQTFDFALGQMIVWSTEQEKYVAWIDPAMFESTKIEIKADPMQRCVGCGVPLERVSKEWESEELVCPNEECEL